MAFQLLCDVNELQEWKKAMDRDSFFFQIWRAPQSCLKDRLERPCSRNLNPVCLGFGPGNLRFEKDPQLILILAAQFQLKYSL